MSKMFKYGVTFEVDNSLSDFGKHRIEIKSDKPGKRKFLHYTKGYRYEGA